MTRKLPTHMAPNKAAVKTRTYRKLDHKMTTVADPAQNPTRRPRIMPLSWSQRTTHAHSSHLSIERRTTYRTEKGGCHCIVARRTLEL